MNPEKALISDIPELVSMRIGYLTADHGPMLPEEEQAIREMLPVYLEKHLDKDLFVYYIKDDGAIVSCAFLLKVEKPMSPSFLNGVTGTVLNVFTRPEHRGHGYARAVMQALMADARKMGFCRLDLQSTEDGYPLYKSVGFKDRTDKYHPMSWKNPDF